MIYIFDKKQAIIKVLTNDDFTAAHLNFKINTATTFEFSLPASKALPSGSKYVATPHPLNDSKFIMLRLTERVDKTETIDYSAYELAYQELATDGYIEDKRPQNQSALNLMKIALDGSNWELNNVNVSGTATTNFYYVDRLSAISKVVDLLGGEIVFYIEIQGNAISGRYMDYLARQGSDTSKVFASGSNLLTVERQSDTSNIYTAILPRGKGKEIDNGEADTPDGYGRRINIADVEWKKSAGKPLDKPKGSIVLSDPDATAEWGQINGNARLLLQTYDDIDDVNVLINSAYKTLQSVNHPQIQYSATVADVGGLSLGDTVLIMHGDRDLSYKTRVFEVKYDLLSPDQTELSLGDDLSSNSITSQINSLSTVADTTSSQTQWTINQIGRPSTTFGNTEPANPKVGDVFFKELPDGGTEIHRWNGNIWELLASPTTADDIAKAVNDAVTQAKNHVEEVKQGLSRDIATANSQAVSLANTAEANAKSDATAQFNQAQNYIDQAKKDINDTVSQYQKTNDRHVSKLQTDVTTALGQIETKISQTDYDKKTGELTSHINDVKDTADKSLKTIADIQEADGKRDDRIAKIEHTAEEITSTVSDLSTAQNKQYGYINTLKQRADGFEETVTKVDNLSVGGRNLVRKWSGQNASDANRPYIKDVTNTGVYNTKGNIYTSDGLFLQINNTKSEMYYSLVNAWTPLSQLPMLEAGETYTIGMDVTGSFDYVAFRISDAWYDPKLINHTKFERVYQQFTIPTDATQFYLRINASKNVAGEADFYDNQAMVIRNIALYKSTVKSDGAPAPEDIELALAQVEVTADSISNFVRDSSGNISSNFQTALSKTSIITGSTLATSIQKQTATQISSAITDNNGKIISLINQDTSGVQIAGKNIVLDGNTTVTGEFYAKGGNFTNLNASNITVGTLNGNTVNITNINASNIVTGAISGANLNINLNTGQVVFQKGRIYNKGVQTSGAGIDVNIDQRYIATSDGYSSSVLKNGMMMLYQSTLVNSGKDPYFQIDNFGTQLTFEGARLRGSKNISLGVYSSSDVPVFGGHSELNGAVFSDGYAARIEGKDKGVKVSGGAAFGSISPASPNILVGVDWLRSGFGGDRIAVNAKYFYLLNQYATTTSSGANMFLTDDGAVIRSSSSSKYKLNINYEQSSETANKLLTIDPALWHDKFESEQLDKFHDIGIEPERTIDMDKRWYYGIIAEDLVKAGLEHLVMRDTKTGEVEGVEYSKIGVALIPIIRELRNRLNEQYVEIERLKEQSK